MSHTKKKKHSRNKKKQTSQSKENRQSRSREKKSERNKDKDKKYKKRPISGSSYRTKSRSESYDKSSSESTSSRSSSSSSTASSVTSSSTSISNDSLVSRNKRNSKNEEKRKKRENIHKCNEKKKKKRNRSISKNKKEKCHKCKSRSRKRKKRCSSKDNQKINVENVDISDKKVTKLPKSGKKNKKRKNSSKDNVEHEPKNKSTEDIKLDTSLISNQNEPEKSKNSTSSNKINKNAIEQVTVESVNLQEPVDNSVIGTIDSNLNVEVQRENESKISKSSKLFEKENKLVATLNLKKKSRKNDTIQEINKKDESFGVVCSGKKSDGCQVSKESSMRIESNSAPSSDLGQLSHSAASSNTVTVRKDPCAEGSGAIISRQDTNLLHDAKEFERVTKETSMKCSKKKKSKKHKVKDDLLNRKTLVAVDAILNKSLTTSDDESTKIVSNLDQCSVGFEQGITSMGNIEICSEKPSMPTEHETECILKQPSRLNNESGIAVNASLNEIQSLETEKSHGSQSVAKIVVCKLIPEGEKILEEKNVIARCAEMSKSLTKECKENVRSRKVDSDSSNFTYNIDKFPKVDNTITNENISAPRVSHSSTLLNTPLPVISSKKTKNDSHCKEIIDLKETVDTGNMTLAKPQIKDFSKKHSSLPVEQELALEQCKVVIDLSTSVKANADHSSDQLTLKPLEEVKCNSGTQLDQCLDSKSKWESVSSSADVCRESTNISDSVQESQISSTIKLTSRERTRSRSRSRSTSYISETNAKQVAKECDDGLKRKRESRSSSSHKSRKHTVQKSPGSEKRSRTRSSSRNSDKKLIKSSSRSKSNSLHKSRSEGKGKSRSKSQSQQRSNSSSKQSEMPDNKQTSPVMNKIKERSRSKSRLRSSSPNECKLKSQNRSKGSSRHRSVSKSSQTSISRDKKKSRSRSRIRTKSHSRSRSPSMVSCQGRKTKKSSGSKRKHRSRSQSKIGKNKCKSRSHSKHRSGSPKGRSTSHTKQISKSHKVGRSRSRSKHRNNRNRTKSKSKCRSRSRSKQKSRSQSRPRSISQRKLRSTSLNRHRSTSRGRPKSSSQSRRRSTSRSRYKSNSESRHRSISRTKRRSTSRSKRRSTSRSKRRSTSRSKRRSRSKSQSRRKSRSQSRRKSRSQSRRKSTSRNRRRSRSRSRRRSRSRSRGRSRSRSRGRSRSQIRRRSPSRSRHRSPSRSRRSSTSRRRRRSTSRRSRRRSTSRRSRRRSMSRSRRRSTSRSRHRSKSRSRHRSTSQRRHRSRSKHRSTSRRRHRSSSRCGSTSRSRRKSTSRNRHRPRSRSKCRSRSQIILSRSQSKHRSRSQSKQNSIYQNSCRSSSGSRHKKEGSIHKKDLNAIGNEKLEHGSIGNNSSPRQFSHEHGISPSNTILMSVNNVDKIREYELCNRNDSSASNCIDVNTVYDNNVQHQGENMCNSISNENIGKEILSCSLVHSDRVNRISFIPEVKEQEIVKCISCQHKNICSCVNVKQILDDSHSSENLIETAETNIISVHKQDKNDQTPVPGSEMAPVVKIECGVQAEVCVLTKNYKSLEVIPNVKKIDNANNLATGLNSDKINTSFSENIVNKEIKSTVSNISHDCKEASHNLNVVSVNMEKGDKKLESNFSSEPYSEPKLSNLYDGTLQVDPSIESINYEHKEPLTSVNDSVRSEIGKNKRKKAVVVSSSPIETKVFLQTENIIENSVYPENNIIEDNFQLRNAVSLTYSTEQTNTSLSGGMEISVIHHSCSNESKAILQLDDQLYDKSPETNISESKHVGRVIDTDQSECKITIDKNGLKCNSDYVVLNLEEGPSESPTPIVEVKHDQSTCISLKDGVFTKESVEQKCENQDDSGTKFKKSSNNELKTVREKKKAKHRSRSRSKERKSKKKRTKSHSKELSLVRQRSRSESKDTKRVSHEKKIERSKSKKKKHDNKEKETNEMKEYKPTDSNQDNKSRTLRSRSSSKEKCLRKSLEKTSKESKGKEDKTQSSERSVKLRSKSRSKSHSKERKSGGGNGKERNRSRSKENKKRKARSRSTEERKRRRRRRSRSHPASQEKIDKKKLLEIAQRNAMAMMKQEVVMSSVISKGKLIVIEKSGKSVAELTDFCKKLSEKEAKSQQHSSQSDDSPSDSDSDLERPYHHPFQLKQQPLPGFPSGKTGQKDKQLSEPPKLLAIQYPTVLKKTGSVSQESQQSQCQIIKSDWVPVSPQVPDTPAPVATEIKRVCDTPKEEIPTIGTEKIKFSQPIKIVTKSGNEGTSSEPESVQRDVNFRWLKSTNKRIQ